MHFKYVFKVLGAMLFFFGLTMLAPLVVALLYGDGDAAAFGLSAAITIIFGGALVLIFNKEKNEINIREGFFIVTMVWVLASAFGALPFSFQGVCEHYTDSYFEASSGLTTTGATILGATPETLVSAQPHGILFWRALTHWIGGMGIILLGLAILPLLGVGGMQLFKAEVPGPTADKLSPRVAGTAKLLWGVYVLITAAEIILLRIGGMGFFDAVCHSFATMGTGGFSNLDLSIEGYDNAYFDYVIGFFMIVAGTNFALYYQLFRGNWRSFYRDGELRFYLWMLTGLILFITFSLWATSTYATFFESFRRAFFQVPAIISTTGFSTADFDAWPHFLRLLLVVMMFVGGMSGSTCGAMKVVRVQLALKHVYHELYRLIHPRVVIPLRLGERTVPEPIMRSINNFIILYLAIFLISSMLMGMLGLDFPEAVSSVAATLGNVGPGLGSIGPHGNYAHIPLAGKWVLIFCMIAGRLELYTVLVLLVPRYWRR